MPLMRNPFKSKPADVIAEGTDGIIPPLGRSSSNTTNGQDNRPREYKLSEITDRGVYIPPSPTETKSSFWSTRSAASTRTSSHRSVLNENEPFSISRESFDSYRRSFDISAKSPVIDSSPMRSRQSLDARQLRLPPPSSSRSPSLTAEKKFQSPYLPAKRPATTPFQPQPNILPDSHINPPETEPEEPDETEAQARAGATESALQSNNPTEEPGPDQFEDIGLGEPADKSPGFKKNQSPHSQTKKPSIFSRFGGNSSNYPDGSQTNAADRPGSSGLGMGLGLFGRKRGASGVGAELAPVQHLPSSSLGQQKKDTVSGAEEKPLAA